MFPLDHLIKKAHGLTMAAKLVNDVSAVAGPKPQTARSGSTRPLPPALAAAAPMMFCLISLPAH